MTAPVILQQLLLLLNNVVDRIWIAHIPDVGQLAFTASGVCVPIVYMIMALAELTGTGISPYVGQLLGRSQHAQAERTLGRMLAFSLLLALLTLTAIEVFCPTLIQLFGGSPQTSAMAESYLRISTPGNALCIVSSMLASFLLVQGLSTQTALVMGSGIVLNMVLDPIFIFLFGWGYHHRRDHLSHPGYQTPLSDGTSAPALASAAHRMAAHHALPGFRSYSYGDDAVGVGTDGCI